MNNPNWNKRFRAVILFSSVLLVMLPGTKLPAQEQTVPVVDGQAGQCTADFTVMDKDKNPLYDAKIDVTFRHGLFGTRKMSLQVGTNSEGKARVIGLPDKSKKTFQFKISFGALSESVLMHAPDDCKAVFDVVLEE